MTHPRLQGRGAPRATPSDKVRVLVYAPDSERLSWIEGELAGRQVLVQVSRTISELVAALVEDPPPRPQLLVVDFDALSAGELLHLHAIREQGWFGGVLALGSKVPKAACDSLKIDRVIYPLTDGDLRAAIPTIDHEMQTVRMEKIKLSRVNG